MKRTVKMVQVECPLSGETGYLPEGVCPDSDLGIVAALDGYLAAHDILEHKNESTVGGVANELEALGAMWYIRGHDGDFRRGVSIMHDPHTVLKNDILGFANDAVWHGCEAPKAGEEPNEDFIYVRHLFAKDFLKEVDGEEFGTADRKDISKYLRNMVQHLQNGYDWAVELYGDIYVGNLFHSMAEDITRIMGEEPYEFNVSYCTESGDYSVDKVELEYDEDDDEYN